MAPPLTGVLWGLAGSVVLVSPDQVAHVVVTFVLGGMTVGAVFQQSAYLPAFFSYALPAVIPQVVCYLARGDRVSIAMGLMLAAYVAVVALMGRYINCWIVAAMRLRLEQTAVNRELRAAVAESKAVLNEIEQIYRYTPVGLCFMDINHRFVRINEHMAEINGLPVSAHIGRTLREIDPRSLRTRSLELHRPVYERGEPVLNAEIHGVTPAAPGVPRYWLANFFPFRSEIGGSHRPDRRRCWTSPISSKRNWLCGKARSASIPSSIPSATLSFCTTSKPGPLSRSIQRAARCSATRATNC